MVNEARGATTGKQAITPENTSVQFRVKMLAGLVRVNGRFTSMRGAITLSEPLEQSSVEVDIDAASITTGLPKRDEDLRSPAYLDAAAHPHMSFRSTSVAASGPGTHIVSGELQIRGTKRPITLEIVSTANGYRATGSLNRRDFGLTKAPGFLIGNNVALELEFSRR